MVGERVAKRIQERRIIGPLADQTLQRRDRLGHLTGAFEHDRVFIFQSRMPGMPLERRLNQSECRVALAMIPEQMNLRERELEALLGMRNRVLIQKRERCGAVGLQQDGRRLCARRDRDRRILKLPISGERRRLICVARRDVSHRKDYALGRRAVCRKIGEATLRLGKITVLEGEERQALINLSRSCTRSAQALKFLAGFLEPIERNENLGELKSAAGGVAHHHFAGGRDGLRRVALYDIYARKDPLRRNHGRVAHEGLTGISCCPLGVEGFERKFREERKRRGGCLRLNGSAQGRKHRRCFGFLEKGRGKRRDAGVGVCAGRLHDGRHSGARGRNLVELERDGGVARRRVGILGCKRPPPLYRLPGRRKILAGKSDFTCPTGDRNAAVHRGLRIVLGGELAVTVLEGELREQRERGRVAALLGFAWGGARRRAAGRHHDRYRRNEAHRTDPKPIHGTHYKVSRPTAHRANLSSLDMKDSIRHRIERMADRFEEVGRLLAAPETAGRSQQFRELSMEYARLQPLAHGYGRYRDLERELTAAQRILTDTDESMRALAAEEIVVAQKGLEAAEPPLLNMLITPDPRDDHNIFLEVRAGTGGDEAALFAGDLLRMYGRYAESKGFTVEVISESPGDHGGYKEIISRIAGRGVFARFKFESGTHRVQRVPATEAQGRIHTSACTIAILPELEEVEAIDINPADLRIDTYRASGAGGQHVNKTDSAVRITHVPSGIVVECQDERSQHKNRSRAMALLKARLLAAEQAKQDNARAQSRRLQVGSGDRSERIRTYNFPQGRVTDHRINLTLYKLADIMNGQLDELLDALQREHQAEELAAEE